MSTQKRITRAFEEFNLALGAGIIPVLSEHYRFRKQKEVMLNDSVVCINWEHL